MFVMICTRPDIAQAVEAVSQYMTNPGKEDFEIHQGYLRCHI